MRIKCARKLNECLRQNMKIPGNKRQHQQQEQKPPTRRQQQQRDIAPNQFSTKPSVADHHDTRQANLAPSIQQRVLKPTLDCIRQHLHKKQLPNHRHCNHKPHHSVPLGLTLPWPHSLSLPLPLLLLLFLLLCGSTMPPQAHADWLMDCGDCHCKWQSGKKTADCKNLSIAAVPENLSNEVQVLDLSFNRIPILEQNAFLNAQLHNLHKLFIRNSSLQQIDPRTFTQLEILIEVDLSNNLLRTLTANVFARLVKVRALVLNGNLLESLGDGVFQNLKYLHKVELKHNRLVRIGAQAFVNVPLLSQIYLDGNRLNFLRKEPFESLKRLTALSLDQNPWNCTCELQIFRDFVLKRNLYTPPTACYHPAHLRGMLWVEDQPEAFACKPRIIYPARGASINTSKDNVTLVCRVHASPNTLIAWDYNKQMYRANTAGTGGSGGSGGLGSNNNGVVGQQQRVHIQLLRDEQSKEKDFGRDVFISRLTILGAEKSDEGIYTCLAENAGGKDAVQMSLLVQKPGPRDLLLQGNLVIVISLMALGLLSVSVFLALVTCCIYKRFKAMSPSHRHHHHHHHLDMNDQLTPGMEHGTTTTMTGGTDVALSGDENTNVTSTPTTLVGSYGKRHAQKTTNINGGVKLEASGKYSEVLKHGVTVMDNNGSLIGGTGSADGKEVGGSGGGSDVTKQAVEKQYLERNAQDTLQMMYPHGVTAAAEINRLLTSATLDVATGKGGLVNNSKWHNGMAAELQQNQQSGAVVGVGSVRAGEYQPDLLPAYSTNKNSSHSNGKSGNQQGQLYSPIKATRTINLHEDQEQLQQPQPHVVAKSKYNISAQEYLQSRFGGAGGPNHSADSLATTNTANKYSGERPTKRELPSFALTTSASLSAAAAAVATTQVESGFSTIVAMQRHSKSVALPVRTPTETPPTSGYEYRQPPPPPYNSTHRTASGLQLLQRRTCPSNSNGNSNLSDNNENSAIKDLGYRDASAYASGVGVVGGGGGGIAVDGARQTIVTASSSLQYLTTTGYNCNTPQRQLL